MAGGRAVDKILGDTSTARPPAGPGGTPWAARDRRFPNFVPRPSRGRPTGLASSPRRHGPLRPLLVGRPLPSGGDLVLTSSTAAAASPATGGRSLLPVSWPVEPFCWSRPYRPDPRSRPERFYEPPVDGLRSPPPPACVWPGPVVSYLPGYIPLAECAVRCCAYTPVQAVTLHPLRCPKPERPACFR